MTTKSDKQVARALGETGEEQAARWYRAAGYRIVDRNWRCFEGELDIVARRGRTTVVCEVKTRSHTRFIDPMLAIGPAKQAKVRAAAYRWLDEQRAHGRVRFDVAIVVGDRVQVIEGAF